MSLRGGCRPTWQAPVQMDIRKIMFIEKILVDPRLSLVYLNYRTLSIQKNTADLLVNGFELVGARGICIAPVEGNPDLP
jgi:hypothetical protein